MFRHAIPIGRIFGISIDLDYSWFLIFGLLTWSLAVGYFPAAFPDWPRPEYWIVGAFTAVMLFVSVLLHELGHSVVAKHYGIPVPRITLYLFGGVSQIATEPPSASTEFAIAFVGPLVSLALALILWALHPLLSGAALATTKYLAYLNFILGLFNLVPGFPLDGGRVFRSVVWGITKNFQRATIIAAITGRFIGFAMISWGAWQAFSGDVLNGVWIAFVGWYLESAAATQAQQQWLKSLLLGHKVSEVMNRDFKPISRDVTLQALVDNDVLTTGRRAFVVNDKGHSGLLTLSAIKQVPHSAWPATTASEVMVPREKLISLAPQEELWTALEKMGRDGVNQLPVLDNGGIVGMLSRDDLVQHMRVFQEIKK